MKISLAKAKNAIILAYIPASYQLSPKTNENKNGPNKSSIIKGTNPNKNSLLNKVKDTNKYDNKCAILGKIS